MRDIRTRPFIGLIPKILILLISLNLLCIVGISIYQCIEAGFWNSGEHITSIVFFIPAVLIVIWRDKPVGYILMAIAVPLGAVQLVECATIFSPDAATLSVIALMVFIALMLISNGIHAFLGDQHSASRLFVLSLAFGLTDIITIVTSVLFKVNIDPVSEPVSLLSSCLSAATFLLFAIFLLQPGVRDETMKRKLKMGMTAVEAMSSVSPRAFIARDDVPALLGENTEPWTHLEDGPVESFHETMLYDDKREFVITSKRWRGSGDITISVDQRIVTSSYGRGFVLKGSSREEIDGMEYIRIYGTDGTFMRILLGDAPSKKSIVRFFHKTENEEVSKLLLDAEEGIVGQRKA